jgi:hypothetical protein
LDVQLGYIYGALAQEFEEKKQPDVVARYRDLQLGIFERVKDDLTVADCQTGEAASAARLRYWEQTVAARAQAGDRAIP